MASTDLDFVWKEFFRDPSLFRDNRHSKRSSRSPDFRNKENNQPLWVDGWHNPPWVQEQLKIRGLTDAWKATNDAEHKLLHKVCDRTSLMESIKACGKRKDLCAGILIHSFILEKGLLKKDTSLGNAVLSMYVKCGDLARAQEVFDDLPARNVVTWNALIAGFSQHGLGNAALTLFERMQDEGLSPNAVTFLCILNACCHTGKGEKGEEIHAEISRQGLLEKDIMLCTALVDMYVKCGKLAKAQEAFNEIPTRNVASWTALIDGYAERGLGNEALSCYKQMQDEDLSPNAVTYVCILKACGNIGALEKGEEIHAEVRRQGLLRKDIVLGTALVDMYAKCGLLLKAEQVFNEFPARDVAMWTSLMAGYAITGKVKRVLDLFIEMVGESIDPNVVTFVVLLNAFSHTGLVEEGQVYFDTMSSVYSVMPTLEHRTCMVDMFCRAGHFDKAIGLIANVPSSESLLSWWALMGACGKWLNVELGRWAFEQALKLDKNSAATYICMRNMYACADMQQEEEEIDTLVLNCVGERSAEHIRLL